MLLQVPSHRLLHCVMAYDVSGQTAGLPGPIVPKDHRRACLQGLEGSMVLTSQ